MLNSHIKENSNAKRGRSVLTSLIYTGKFFSMITLLVLMAFILLYIYAHNRLNVKIRRFPFIDAIEEYVGRAVETGRPVLWTPGMQARLNDQNGPMVLAGINILNHTARLCARKGCKIAVAYRQEELDGLLRASISEAYRIEGKEDASQPEDFGFFPANSYTTGTVGMIEKLKPALFIMTGYLAHETVIFLEAAIANGSVNLGAIAGPFDNVGVTVLGSQYTLIGEELYAAGAYLSNDPIQISCIGGQDLGKYIILALTVIGIIAVAAGYQASFMQLFAW